MNPMRALRHLLVPDWWPMRALPKTARQRIEAAIGRSETGHSGELRCVVEASLPLDHLLAGVSPRERAVELFSRLKIWDTDGNSGVLIYIQLLDRQVEIVADRGIHQRVGQAFWNEVSRNLESRFQAGDFEQALLAAIDAITAELIRYFPATADNLNELPDSVVVL